MSAALDRAHAVMRRIAECRKDDFGREALNHVCTHAGGSIATDGHMAVCSPCKDVGTMPFPYPLPWMSIPATWTAAAKVSDLKAWCGEDVWPSEGDCPDCIKGRDKCGCGDGACRECGQACPDCGGTGVVPCEYCDGRGVRVSIAPRYAWLDAARTIAVDQTVVGQALDAFDPSESVEISGSSDTDPVQFRAGEVLAVVMPCVAHGSAGSESPGPIVLSEIGGAR